MTYQSRTCQYNIKTPSRRRNIRRLTRRSYPTLVSALANSPSTRNSVIKKLAAMIRSEMKSLSSSSYDSILRDTIEAVKHFHWDTVLFELLKKVPTLMALLNQVIKRSAEKKPLLCMVASQLLKSYHPCMGLVQRAVSIMLYGNGTAKQVSHDIEIVT